MTSRIYRGDRQRNAYVRGVNIESFFPVLNNGRRRLHITSSFFGYFDARDDKKVVCWFELVNRLWLRRDKNAELQQVIFKNNSNDKMLETYDIWKDGILRVRVRVNKSRRAELSAESDRNRWMNGTYHLWDMIELGRFESDMDLIWVDDGHETRELQEVYKCFEIRKHFHSRWLHRCLQVQPRNQILIE